MAAWDLDDSGMSSPTCWKKSLSIHPALCVSEGGRDHQLAHDQQHLRGPKSSGAQLLVTLRGPMVTNFPFKGVQLDVHRF